jgi:N-succinyldiaminopimelate aminotransferase
MNPDLNKLHAYPFEKLKNLFAGVTANPDLKPINLSIGEPKSPTPDLIKQALIDNIDSLAKYPKTKGELELRSAICNWLLRRFNLPETSLNPERHILPVNGSREALFAIAQTIIDQTQAATVISPNPFYQIYEGAALLAGAELLYLDLSVQDGKLPALDTVDAATWKKTQMVYICTPSNPTGDVIPQESLQYLIQLAHEYDFVIISDECYSEIYFDEQHPPKGLLQASQAYGDHNYQRCLAFYSLSKRSNAPGLRSGFVVGDEQLISKFFKYRTYHGCAMPISTQMASAAAWSDEQHVELNRERYRQSFQAFIEELQDITTINQPQAGFYIWLNTRIDDEEFALGLYSQHNVTVLPGQYLGRSVNGTNPGAHYVRIALVAAPQQCREAAQRIRRFISSHC